MASAIKNIISMYRKIFELDKINEDQYILLMRLSYLLYILENINLNSMSKVSTYLLEKNGEKIDYSIYPKIEDYEKRLIDDLIEDGIEAQTILELDRSLQTSEKKGYILENDVDTEFIISSKVPDCVMELIYEIFDVNKSNEKRILDVSKDLNTFFLHAAENGSNHQNGYEYDYLPADNKWNEICRIRKECAAAYINENGTPRENSYDFVYMGDDFKNCLEHVKYLKINDKSKAALVVNNAQASNYKYQKTREKLIENGYVECIIDLPKYLLKKSSDSYSLLILSLNNEKIRIVDAIDIYKKGIRHNKLNKKCIKDIINLIEVNTIISKDIDYDEIKETNYILRASKYLFVKEDRGIQEKLENLCFNIFRGNQKKSTEMNYYRAYSNSKYKLILNGCISERGILLDECTNLTMIDESLEKFKVKNHSIIITRVGKPDFKSGIVELKDDEICILDGNMFCLEVNEQKINPYYVAAFFASEKGKKELHNICSGSSTLSISKNKLSELKIPVLDKRTQDILGNKYKNNIEILNKCYKEYNDIVKSIKNII